jgi:hypothetical protein
MREVVPLAGRGDLLVAPPHDKSDELLLSLRHIVVERIELHGVLLLAVGWSAAQRRTERRRRFRRL